MMVTTRTGAGLPADAIRGHRLNSVGDRSDPDTVHTRSRYKRNACFPIPINQADALQPQNSFCGASAVPQGKSPRPFA